MLLFFQYLVLVVVCAYSGARADLTDISDSTAYAYAKARGHTAAAAWLHEAMPSPQTISVEAAAHAGMHTHKTTISKLQATISKKEEKRRQTCTNAQAYRCHADMP